MAGRPKSTNGDSDVAEVPQSPNEGLGLEQFDYKHWTPEKWEAYQKVMQSLKARQLYDFEEYNAVGQFKRINDPITDEVIETNILIGIQLVKDAPLKTTRIELQHIEDWRFDQRSQKLKLAAGLNAQIYDKSNPKTNSRFYLLKQPKEVSNA